MDLRIIWLLLISLLIISTVVFLVRYIMKNYVFPKNNEKGGENKNDKKGSGDAGSKLIKSVRKDKLN